MTTSALIDLLLTHTEEVGATDAENATLRARHLARAQEIADKVWNYADDWDFMLTSGSVTITSGVGDLPADFGSLGSEGGVFVPADKRKLFYLEPREFETRLQQFASTGSNPEYFTIHGINTSTYARKIRTYPTGSATLTVNYNRICPTLVDATGSTNQLQVFPAQFHYPVFVAGLQLKAAIDKGDGRASEFDAWFEREMRRMKAQHQYGKEQLQVLSQYGGIQSFNSW